MINLILGGVRSGKSRYAEQCATQSAASKIFYIATAYASDNEMQQRILQHQNARPQHWHTIEAPIHLAAILQQNALHHHCLLVDCLTLWLSNIMFNTEGELQQKTLEMEKTALLNCLPQLPGNIIFVSNEIGQGVIAANKSTRQFVDELGMLHQQIAALSDRVVLITAGLPQILKS